MMIRSFVLLSTLAVAHGKDLTRKLQPSNLCQTQVNSVLTCEGQNRAACTNDDPFATYTCFTDVASAVATEGEDGNDFAVVPEVIDTTVACDTARRWYCNSAGCCGGRCTAEYRAYYQCYANWLGNCGALLCTSPTAAPVTSSTCFSATSTVKVLDQGPVQMQNLQVGDQVLTGSPDNYKYQPVYAFGHLDTAALGTFYAITTKANQAPLEMTGEHLVYLAEKHNPVRADSLAVGDVLLSIHGPTEVTAIDIVTKQGLFNPLTADGRLVVDDIAVSTYIALQDNDKEQFQLVLDKQGANNINLGSHHNFVHLYLAPFRMLCMGISSQLCQVHDAEGIPLYISYGMKLVQWIGEQHVVLQLGFLLVTIPIVLLFFAMEKMVGSSVAPLAVFALVLLAKKAPTMMMRKQKVA